MRSLSKRAGSVAAVLAVSTILIAQGAFASAQQLDRGGLLGRLLRAKQIVVKILSDIGLPPG